MSGVWWLVPDKIPVYFNIRPFPINLDNSWCFIKDSSFRIEQKQGASLRVHPIEINGTEQEAKGFNNNHPAKQGLPYAIDSTCTVKVMQGTKKTQGYVYPSMWHSFGKRRPHDQSASLFSKASLIHTRH
jgi:hypothetical protein